MPQEVQGLPGRVIVNPLRKAACYWREMSMMRFASWFTSRGAQRVRLSPAVVPSIRHRISSLEARDIAPRTIAAWDNACSGATPSCHTRRRHT